jgi:phospholipid-binding lipoprotein MlaA
MRVMRKAVVLAASLLVVAGCSAVPKRAEVVALDQPGPYENLDQEEATVVTVDEYQDPLEGFNRSMFYFNDKAYRYFLTPLAKGYLKITPKPVNRSIGNFFFNLREPLFCINNLFQARPAASGKSLLRLGINSTLGLLGLFDPADAWWNLEREKTTVGDTLAFYGVGYGAYIVFPLAGPNDLRSSSSIVLEYFLHPLNYLDDKKTATSLKLFSYFQDKASTLDNYEPVLDEAVDPYIFTRNLYLQGLVRDAEARRNEDEDKNSDTPQTRKTEQTGVAP